MVDIQIILKNLCVSKESSKNPGNHDYGGNMKRSDVLKLATILLLATPLLVSNVLSSQVAQVVIHTSGTITASTSPSAANMICIYDQPWLYQNRNILSTNLAGVINTLKTANFQYVILFIGYWNAANPKAPTIGWFHDATFYKNVISQFHSIGMKVLAWIENDGTTLMDTSPANRANIYPVIISAMNIGFDGYLDDIEQWFNESSNGITAVAQQGDWFNSLTPVLHNGTNFADGQPRLNTPAVGQDYTETANNHLNVDFICSMFFWDSTLLANSNCNNMWQQEFDEQPGVPSVGPPTSPLVIGIIVTTQNPSPYDTLAGQITKLDTLLSTYAHPMLYGFYFWIYEYFSAEDFASWESWQSTLAAKNIPLHS
jgi:hypothetical protein